MSELILSLAMICTPFEYRTVDGFYVLPNCARDSQPAIERAWADVRGNHDAFWQELVPGTTPVLIGRYWFSNYTCAPSMKFGVMRGEPGGKIWLVLHPDILTDRGEMAKAMDYAARAHEGLVQADLGAFHACQN